MVKWFWERRDTGRKLQLRSREDLGDATRVDFEELAPDLTTYLGQAAYLQLGYFETLSELIALNPELSDKESLSRAAGAALTKHEELVALIRRDSGARWYVVPMAAIGALISTWHYLVEWNPTWDSESCGLFGQACSYIWFRTFGFSTLAFMALCGFVAIIVFNTVTFPRWTESEQS